MTLSTAKKTPNRERKKKKKKLLETSSHLICTQQQTLAKITAIMPLMRAIDRLETKLDYLKTDCTLIDVVLKSLQNFFLVRPLVTEEQLAQMDRELSIAYDDVLTQIRILYRNVNKLDIAIQSLSNAASQAYLINNVMTSINNLEQEKSNLASF